MEIFHLHTDLCVTVLYYLANRISTCVTCNTLLMSLYKRQSLLSKTKAAMLDESYFQWMITVKFNVKKKRLCDSLTTAELCSS